MNIVQTSTDQLASLIGVKLHLVELLVRLARRQLELIQVGEMNGLIKLLSAKQTTLRHLQEVERQLDPYRNEDPERRVWRSGTERSACQLQAERCNALLAETMELEKQGEAAMVLRRDFAAASLAAAQTAADARTAYASTPVSRSTSLQVEG
jgi:FlgN protein.